MHKIEYVTTFKKNKNVFTWKELKFTLIYLKFWDGMHKILSFGKSNE